MGAVIAGGGRSVGTEGKGHEGGREAGGEGRVEAGARLESGGGGDESTPRTESIPESRGVSKKADWEVSKGGKR